MAPDDTRRVVAVVVAAPGSVARVVIILQLGKCRHSLVRQRLDACKLLRWHQLRTGRHSFTGRVYHASRWHRCQASRLEVGERHPPVVVAEPS